MRTPFFVLAVISLLSSCRDSADQALPCQEITLDAEFVAKVHDTWCLPDESVKVTFNSIVEDSRCNVKDIDCVWAGRGVLELVVDTDETTEYRDTLATDESWTGSIDIGSYTLELTRIIPLERDEIQVDTASYRFHMVLKEE